MKKEPAPAIIVYGPYACGKSYRKFEIATMFGISPDNVFDEWQPGSPIRPGSLVLVSGAAPAIMEGEDVVVIPFRAFNFANRPRWPADLDVAAARALRPTDEGLSDGGRFFDESFSDLTKCGHGETGEYQNTDDGELIEFLWNAWRAGKITVVEEPTS